VPSSRGWWINREGLQAQFTPNLPVSSLGALVFHALYLAATGAFDSLVADTPLS
jgi:hypothetical protein